MKKYEVTGSAITLHAGCLKLTKEQAGKREHVLRAVDAEKGIYELRGATQFKRGEKFGFDGELPKALAEDLEELSRKRAAEEDAARKAAEEEAARKAAEEAEAARLAAEQSNQNTQA